MATATGSKVGIDRRAALLIAATAIPVLIVILFVDPFPQSADYYDFADKRRLLGIPNFWNVASNAPFLVFGIAGISLIIGKRDVAILRGLKTAYLVLFSGIALTAFGSGWFHLDPGNDTLYWDRLPMTIAFMPLFAVILGEHVSENLARRLVWPLLIAGIGSVLYWKHTESLGAGDLRLYGLVQFLPMLLIPVILVNYRSVFDSTRFFWVAIGLYALAKVLEHLDGEIYAAGGIISGHSLKHIAASLVPLVLINGIRVRQPRGATPQPDNQTTS